RLGLFGQDGEGLGRRHGPVGAHPQGTHARGHQRGVQQGWQSLTHGGYDKKTWSWDPGPDRRRRRQGPALGHLPDQISAPRPGRGRVAGRGGGDALPGSQPRWKEPVMTTEPCRMPRGGVFLCVASSVLLLLGSVVLLWWVGTSSAAPPATADETAPTGPDSLD